jgi:hypothetical protein
LIVKTFSEIHRIPAPQGCVVQGKGLLALG